VAYSFGHNITLPRDAASGLPTGKRQHSPLKILKEIDKSSPLLYNALVNNENLVKAKLRFYRINQAGQEEHYFTIELVNASIVSITPSFPASFLGQNESYRHISRPTWCTHVSWRDMTQAGQGIPASPQRPIKTSLTGPMFSM